LLLLRWKAKHQETCDAATMGIGFGLSAVFYKSLALDALQIGFEKPISLLPLLTDARLWLFIGTYALGFLYSQIGLSRGRALFVIPFSAALGTLLPILAGALVFSEPFPVPKILSALCVVAGSFLFVESNPQTTPSK